MTEDRSTHRDFGHEDHHHLGKAKHTPFDPNHKADPEVMKTVWNILQGNVAPTDEPPIPAGHIQVEVPFDYVHACAFFIMRELKKKGCTTNFSVKVDPEAPQVEITWIRPGGLALPGRKGNGFGQKTNCMAAFMSKLDPAHVGQAAVEIFLEKLSEGMQEPTFAN